MKRSDPLVAILQLTPGMLAGDLSPTRLEQARRKLLDLLRTRNDAQTAIVVYAGSAHTWCRCRTTSSPRATCSTP